MSWRGATFAAGSNICWTNGGNHTSTSLAFVFFLHQWSFVKINRLEFSIYIVFSRVNSKQNWSRSYSTRRSSCRLCVWETPLVRVRSPRSTPAQRSDCLRICTFHWDHRFHYRSIRWCHIERTQTAEFPIWGSFARLHAEFGATDRVTAILTYRSWVRCTAPTPLDTPTMDDYENRCRTATDVGCIKTTSVPPFVDATTKLVSISKLCVLNAIQKRILYGVGSAHAQRRHASLTLPIVKRINATNLPVIDHYFGDVTPLQWVNSLMHVRPVWWRLRSRVQ